MSKYKLHPISAIINCVKALKSMLIPIAIIAVANGFNFSFDFRDERFFQTMFPLIILSIAVLFTLFNGIIKWWTFTYWFEDNELRVQHGLFVKKKRFIPYDRIQSLNYKEGIFHRIFGLVQVTVETAGNKAGKAEAELTAITREAANMIENETKKVKETQQVLEGEELPTARLIHKMSPKDLIILATTSNSIGVVLAGVLAVVSQFSEFIPYDWIYAEMEQLLRFGFLLIIAFVIFGLLVAWGVSVAITFINYYNFEVSEENERLIITRGLLEKKRITIPLNRVQAIKIVENPFRQLFGLAAVIVESAGGGFGGEKDKTVVLFPLISKKKMNESLQLLFSQFDLNLEGAVRPPKRARPYFYRIDFVWLVPLIGALSYFFFPYGMLSLLLIIPVLLLGIWQFKTARFKISNEQITIMYRALSRVTFIAEKRRIQIVEQQQNYFQKRKNIASAKIVVMSGVAGASAKAYHMEAQHIDEFMRWYER
ncbi:PH domain-containing protein [Metasolibacillus meyeri]|uniref:PH domain-containing protein n=1 Tax=Metasolibacillus meyeri TaxID=1071052 RepID=A0AAW9NY80_9BACL|nr:PH domain-containing protein [Metasolibacillus meyeri]MEC1180273.1 PH domain-containing protein [Metasolibacillus meyeri]